MSNLPTATAVRVFAQNLGRSLDENQDTLLSSYLDLLVKWNKRMNLVGPTSWQEILETLIQDSWYLADFLQGTKDPGQVLDLGAGAGLPGIPLRIFWQVGDYYLVEPRHKRAIFMEWAVSAMGLPRTWVFCGRMEELPGARRRADLVVSRAFKPWAELLTDVREYLAPDGRVLIMSNAARPDTRIKDYALEATQEYLVAGKKRYFWLFAFIGESL